MKTITTLFAIALIAGCATKDYGRIDTPKTAHMSCETIEAEIDETYQFLAQVEQESEFDARSVGSFLLDFGIGNVMEKDAALESANRRMKALQGAHERNGC